LAYLHIVEVMEADLRHGGTEVPTSALRDRFTGTLMVNGGYDLERGNAVLSSKQADLVSFGIPFIANPDLPQRFAVNAPLNPADSATFYGGGEKGYIDYPSLAVAS
jgi:N-ethylmaleimide reductase